MAKIVTTTSMNRGGVAIQTNSTIDIPENEAVALCRAGLAKPEGWELPAMQAAPSGESESLVDPPAASKKPGKRTA